MAAGCGPTCARVLLIIFNIIFWLSGAALVALGVLLLVNADFTNNIEFLNYVAEVIPDASVSMIQICAYALIAIGVFVLIVGFCGCCGAIKESKCMLGFYIFFLVVVMLCEGAVGGLMIWFRSDILATADEQFKDLMTTKYESDGNVREVVNNVQQELMCCGWAGVDDYSEVSWDGVDDIVPSCCVLPDTYTGDFLNVTWSDVGDATAQTNCQDLTNMDLAATGRYQQSCKDGMENWIEENSIILIGVAIGIACLELFGIIFACCLCRNIESD